MLRKENELDISSLVGLTPTEAQEIAELTAFLAGPRSTFCTGSDFTADGGLLAGLRLY